RGTDSQGRPQPDALRWYCPNCDALVHEASWVLKKIDEDLCTIMNNFWDGPESARTCPRCGHIIKRAGAIALKKGKVRRAIEVGSATSMRSPRRPAKKRRAGA